MDLLADLQLEHEYNAQVQIQADHFPRRRKWFKRRTSEQYFENMCDFEFLRTFRFSKEGVRHLTDLLGISCHI